MKFPTAVFNVLSVLTSLKGLKVLASDEKPDDYLRRLESCDKPANLLSCAADGWTSVCRSPPQDTMNPCWLKEISDSVMINVISLPGTHDTMTYPDNDVAFNAIYSGLGNAVTCQVWDLETQLDAGIRSIDIRILATTDTSADNKIQLVHGDVHLHDRFFEDVWKNVTTWLEKHNTEFVLMHIQTDSNIGNYPWNALARIMGPNWKQERRLHGSINPNLYAKWPALKDARGKVFVAVGVSENANGLFNDYDSRDDIVLVKPDSEFARVKIASNVIVPLDAAKLYNPWLDRLSNKQKVGVIHMDFPSEKSVKAVIDCNAPLKTIPNLVNCMNVQFKNLATIRVIDSNYDGNAYTGSYNGGNFQRWRLCQVSTDNNHILQNVATSLVLDTNFDGKVYTGLYNGGNYQKWKRTAGSTSGYEYLQNVATSMVLDSNNNGNIYTGGKNGGGFQQWTAIDV